MKKPRIYVDTSVIGGCLDLEFEEWSRSLLNDFRKGDLLLLLSEVVEAEALDGPPEVAEVYREFKELTHEFLFLTTEVIDLANAYLKHGVVSRNFLEDAQHIALATIAKADALLSWNFRHVVNFQRVRKFNAVNLEMGYTMIEIHSPLEVIRHADQSR